VQVENERLIPTRSGIHSETIGPPDLVTVEVPEAARVVAGGTVGRFDDPQLDAVRYEPDRLQVDGGIPSEGRRSFRFVVSGPEGVAFEIRYGSEKARDIETTILLEEGG